MSCSREIGRKGNGMNRRRNLIRPKESSRKWKRKREEEREKTEKTVQRRETKDNG
jgi:hypothetical protein